MSKRLKIPRNHRISGSIYNPSTSLVRGVLGIGEFLRVCGLTSMALAKVNNKKTLSNKDKDKDKDIRLFFHLQTL